MMAADHPHGTSARLLAVTANGNRRHLPRGELAALFSPGDVVIANDAATLPASLHGTHSASGAPIEARLAAWIAAGDPSRFVALAFGAGDHRTVTEDRPCAPPLVPGDRLALGPLVAVVERLVDHPRLVELRFEGNRAAILARLARHGRAIQYAHIAEPLALWDIWTRIAALPFAFEAPSAGFALDWQMLAAWRRRGVGFATLTHAAGISSTGDSALDRKLPFDEPYRIPERTVAAIERAKSTGGHVIAIGTSVVRALESAADSAGGLRAGEGVARGRITEETQLTVVDALLTGIHQPGDSHFELLRAFLDHSALEQISRALVVHGYRTHEFGDSLLVHRQLRCLTRQ